MTARYTTAGQYDRKHPPQRGPNGNWLCRFCKTETANKRRTFCSDACIHEWNIRSNGAYARAQVYARDRGVCCLCGLDCSALNGRLKRYDREHPMPIEPGKYFATQGSHRRQALGRDTGRSTLWDVDHIIAVVDGGGSCGLENLRTLCIWCHKRATRLLARRRARDRVSA